MRREGIGVNVHYIPVHMHPYYQTKRETFSTSCPQAEEAYTKIVSLPIFPKMTDKDIENVVTSIRSLF